MHREMNRENWMHREKLSPWTRIWSISLHPHRESANIAARHTQISRLPRDSWLKRRSGSRPWCKLHKQIKTSRKSKQQVLNAHLVYNLLAPWNVTRRLRALYVMMSSPHRSEFPLIIRKLIYYSTVIKSCATSSGTVLQKYKKWALMRHALYV